MHSRRSQCPCGLRRNSEAAILLRSGFESRWENGYSSLVLVVSRVGSGLCDELITRSEESYRTYVYLCVV